jgi:uncharacterized protein YdhG (YjbR/CyaY superfamily)
MFGRDSGALSARCKRGEQVPTSHKPPQTIDAYIADFPPAVQKRLQQVRKTIAKAAPGAEEVISYRIPAFKRNGYLVYFAGFKNHIGLYPARVKPLEKELAAYQGGKGTVQFPHDTPLPLDLIIRIVKHRVAENLAKSQAKTKTKPAAKSKATKARTSRNAKAQAKPKPRTKANPPARPKSKKAKS